MNLVLYFPHYLVWNTLKQLFFLLRHKDTLHFSHLVVEYATIHILQRCFLPDRGQCSIPSIRASVTVLATTGLRFGVALLSSDEGWLLFRVSHGFPAEISPSAIRARKLAKGIILIFGRCLRYNSQELTIQIPIMWKTLRKY